MTEFTSGSVSEVVAAAEFQLLVTPEGRAAPYPHYEVLRDLAPVHYSAVANGWLLSRYDDCHAVLRDPRFVRGYVQSMDIRAPEWRSRPAMARSELSMLNMDGPDHTRLRRLVVKAFTPRTVEALRPRVESFVDELLDVMAAKGGGDLMAELAFPLPVRVIGELLGVPPEDQEPFRGRIQDLTAMFEVTATHEMLDAADAAQLEIDRYFEGLIEEKRKNPGDDLLSKLIAVEDDDDGLSGEELGILALLVFAAGFETTTNLIGNAMLGLLAHPDQIALLRAKPEYFSELPDELLRYDGTVQISARLATEAVPVGDQVIEEGQPVFPLLGAANHDPARYDHPDRLDVTRTDIRPLTFGGGVHFCLGAALARAETEIVFRKLLERFGTIELAGEAPFRDRLTLRGPSVLPLHLAEEAAQVRPAATRPATMAQAATRSQPAPAPAVGGVDGLGPRPAGGPEDSRWLAEYRARLERGSGSAQDLPALVALLARIPLFAGCTPGELDDVARTAYPLGFDPGDVLCEEGTDSLECYVISEGEAEVRVDGRVVATVGSDDVVGERGPLLGARRMATVTAISHMNTYAISRERLRRLAGESDAVRLKMEDALRARFGDEDGHLVITTDDSAPG